MSATASEPPTPGGGTGDAAQYLAALVETSDEAIVSTDLDGRILSWNDAATAMYGYTAEEAVGQAIDIFVPEDPALRQEELDIRVRIARGERIENYQTVRRRKDGTRFEVSVSISPVRDASGRIVAAAGFTREISRRPTGQLSSPGAQFGHERKQGPLLQIDPGFAGEVIQGRDLLGIAGDASALAVLLSSASLSPPLALGLYGEWGSGKTFFMRAIEDSIGRLTATRAPGFCQHVTSVWFNAWHYAEGNLWASLIHHIFSSLHGETSAPEQALNDALATIVGIREAKAAAAKQADAAQDNAERVRKMVSDLEFSYQRAKQNAAKIRARDVWAAISVDDDLRRSLDETANQLGLPEVSADVREVAQVVGEVRSLVESGRSLATVGPWWKSPLVLGLVTAAATSVLGLIVATGIHWGHAWLAPMVAAVGQLAALAGGAASWLSRQTILGRKLLEPAERVQRQIDRRLAKEEIRYRAESAAAQQDLIESGTQLTTARQQLATAEAEETIARDEFQQLTGARLLKQYLAERANSSDYGQYLGAVALAHRDLRDLDAYIRTAVSDGKGAGSIDRIILYIDDLDRCRPETVVQVLEAVNLLLALPLFVVVVGVDGRWLMRSLKDRHPILLGNGESMPESASGTAPTDYLDKIFQLTYHLPPMTADSCAALLRYTATNVGPSPGVLPGFGESPTEDDSGIFSGISHAELSGESDKINDMSQYPAEAHSVDAASALEPELHAAEALVLDEDELNNLRTVAPLVSSSPRRAKRFLNIYRVIKARALTDPELQTDLLADSGQKKMTSGLLVLTALSVGLPKSVTQELDNYKSTNDQTLHEWITDHGALLASSKAESQRLTDFVTSADTLADVPMSNILHWLPIARRFAWPPTEYDDLHTT
jgi:PAS domain S-box-containing protein